MTEPTSATQYDDRGTEATRRVLLELAHVLGTYRDRLVIIGGIVPTLLLEGAETPHIGTLDIDLTLDAEALRENDEYAALIELLEGAGYARNVGDAAPDLRPFQLRRPVDLQDGGAVVDVIVDLLRPAGSRLTKHRPPLTQGLRGSRRSTGAAWPWTRPCSTGSAARRRTAGAIRPRSGSSACRLSWRSRETP